MAKAAEVVRENIGDINLCHCEERSDEAIFFDDEIASPRFPRLAMTLIETDRI